MKKINIRNRIRLISWTALIGVLLLSSLSIYNALIYTKNMEKTKQVISLIDKNTDPKIKKEIISKIQNNITSSIEVLYILFFIGITFIALIVYLGVTLRKEISRRIHAMDWIIENDDR